MRSNRAMLPPAIPLVVALVLASGATVVHAQTPAADPPSRVGRTALLLGTVSFHTADQTDWTVAALNYPVTSGNAFWTQPSSAAEIDVGPTHLALDQSTEFDIDTLDDHNFRATEAQGAIFLRLRNVPIGDTYSITTPRGVAVITQAGAYEIVAGDADHPTTVTVVEGAARIDSTNASLTLSARQTGRIDGASNFAASVGLAAMDPFVTARLAEEQRAARASRSSAPPVVAQMTGGYALDSVGSWAPSPEYGRIWYPPVAATWVPYRDGHWGYVAPWGWTWIDDASWGFAPFHYGRWVREGTRWGWIPAERAEQQRSREEPVYAPALVTFLGVRLAVGGGQRDRGGEGSVGWIPLGPREAYVPPYHTSDRYERAVNSNNVTTTTNVTNVTTVNNYVNRGAATMVPAAAMTTSQPIAARAEPVNAQVLAGARTERAAPVQPTAATVGVTPVVAQQLKIAPAPAAAKPAPGPALPPPSPVAAPPAAAKPGVVALPVAAALPVLRPPTPIAPAHPKAGGTVVGAPVPSPASVAPVAPVVPLPPIHPAGVPGSAATPPAIASPVTGPHPAIAPPVPVPTPPVVHGGAPAPVPPPVASAPAPHGGAPVPPIAPAPSAPPHPALAPAPVVSAPLTPPHPVAPPPSAPAVAAPSHPAVVPTPPVPAAAAPSHPAAPTPPAPAAAAPSHPAAPPPPAPAAAASSHLATPPPPAPAAATPPHPATPPPPAPAAATPPHPATPPPPVPAAAAPPHPATPPPAVIPAPPPHPAPAKPADENPKEPGKP